MNLSRRIERVVRFALDECLPPLLRDNPWLMGLAFKAVFKDKAARFLDFKARAWSMSADEIRAVYEDIASIRIQHEGTDLSPGVIRKISANIRGSSALDVGCGDGVLAGALSLNHRVTACDILIEHLTVERYPDIRFEQASVAALPFGDGAFDTVTCTHTLEHVQDFAGALRELRRVAKRRLIIVLPKERPYLYTFNLHLHFFPYRHTAIERLRGVTATGAWELTEIDGGWYYHEDIAPRPSVLPPIDE